MKKPPSQRPGHSEPSGEVPSHAQLRQLVLDFGPHLEEVWAGHRYEGDILILGDIRSADSRRMAISQHGIAKVDRLQADARRAGLLSMVAFAQDSRFLDLLSRSSCFAQREAAKELRSFAALSGFGVVPLLVVTVGGLWATQWSPAGSGTVIHRFEPETPVDTNL
jgi:hypothetical protein